MKQTPCCRIFIVKTALSLPFVRMYDSLVGWDVCPLLPRVVFVSPNGRKNKGTDLTGMGAERVGIVRKHFTRHWGNLFPT